MGDDEAMRWGTMYGAPPPPDRAEDDRWEPVVPRRWGAPERVPAELDTPGRMALLEDTVREAGAWVSVRGLARDCLAMAERRSATRRGVSLGEAVADVALSLVQRVPYRLDPPGVDTYQGVGVTLAQGGDCEDLSSLFVGLVEVAAILSAGRARVQARLYWLERPGAEQDHITAQVRTDGGAWQWAECSVAGARRGEWPPAAAARLAPHRAELLAVKGGA